MVIFICFSALCVAQSSVATFGPIRVGAPGPIRVGAPTAHPYKAVPRSKFYILVVAKNIPTMCTFEDCGKEGAIVEALGGWITGDDQSETIDMVGLDEQRVRSGNQSLIVVQNRFGNVVGIYPNSKLSELPIILDKHRALWKSARR